MATSKDDGGVVHVVQPNGDHALGVKIDGVFVAFVVKDGNYIDSLVAAGKSPEVAAASGGDSEGGE